MTKVIGNLPLHNAMRLRLQFWKIDSWDNEFAKIIVDGIEVWSRQFIYYQGFPGSICGQNYNEWNENIVDIDVTFNHIDSAAKVTITTTLDQAADDESWGVRDFQLFSIQKTAIPDPGADGNNFLCYIYPLDPTIFYKAF